MTAADVDEPLRALTADLLDLIVEARKHVLRNSKLDVLLLRMRDRVLEDADRVDPPVAKPMPLIMSSAQLVQTFGSVPPDNGLANAVRQAIGSSGDLHGPHQPPPAGNTLPS